MGADNNFSHSFGDEIVSCQKKPAELVLFHDLKTRRIFGTLTFGGYGLSARTMEFLHFNEMDRSKSAECANFPGVTALVLCIRARLFSAASDGTGKEATSGHPLRLLLVVG
jgi:hypothetical protein